MRYKLIRLVLRLWVLGKPVWLSSAAPVQSPPQFRVWRLSEAIKAGILPEVVKAYIQVFGGRQWQETHTPEDVFAKIQRELVSETARLVTMQGNDEWPVAGFAWGDVIPLSAVGPRILAARFLGHGVESQQVLKPLLDKLEEVSQAERILFLDEIGVVRGFRGGLAPIQFLIRPVIELGYLEGVQQAFCWTSRRSAIFPMTTGMGFGPVEEVEGILYLFSPNTGPFLRLIQNTPPEEIRKILSITSGRTIRQWARRLKPGGRRKPRLEVEAEQGQSAVSSTIEL